MYYVSGRRKSRAVVERAAVTIVVGGFQWDDRNTEHCAQHGLTPGIAYQVRDGAPLFFPNKPGRTGTHMMIGPSGTNRLWTVILLPACDPDEWRCITGWPSTQSEAGWYHGAMARRLNN